MNTKKSLAFIVELLGLFILLILVIVIITQVLVMSRAHSLQAKQLTQAVILAENTAEAASVSPELKDLADRMTDMDYVVGTEMSDDDELTASLDMDNDTETDDFVIKVVRGTEEGSAGKYVSDKISVYYGDSSASGEPVYTLDTGCYFAARE